MDEALLTTAQLQFAKERLLQLADDFREAAEQYSGWSAGDRIEEPRQGKYYDGALATNAVFAGIEMHPIVHDGLLRLPPAPQKLRDRPTGFDMLGDKDGLFDMWWLAFVGWLETSESINFVCQSTPSYPSQVYRYWEPSLPIGSLRSDLEHVDPHPSQWLCMNPDLTRQYGQDACLQSAAAIDFLMNRIVESTTADRSDTVQHSTSNKEPEQDAQKKLKPCELIAYQQYEHTAKRMGITEPTDMEVYDWLKEHPDVLESDPIPSFDTWQRHVRAGRGYYKTQKNTPRAGREGRSIVRKNDQ